MSTMTSFTLRPLHYTTLGFERFFNDVERLMKDDVHNKASNFPPHNIIRLDDNRYVVEMKRCVAEMRVKLSVIENDYLNKHTTISARFDDLNLAVKDLTNEIKLLNKEIQNKLN